jgi:hypothetical protein
MCFDSCFLNVIIFVRLEIIILPFFFIANMLNEFNTNLIYAASFPYVLFLLDAYFISKGKRVDKKW